MEYTRAYRIEPILPARKKRSTGYAHTIPLSFHDVGNASVSIRNVWYKLTEVPNSLLNSACNHLCEEDTDLSSIHFHNSPPYDDLTRWYLVCQFHLNVRVERSKEKSAITHS